MMEGVSIVSHLIRGMKRLSIEMIQRRIISSLREARKLVEIRANRIRGSMVAHMTRRVRARVNLMRSDKTVVIRTSPTRI